MVLQLHIDELSEDMTVRIADLRKLLSAKKQEVALCCRAHEENAPRIRLLEETIKQAVTELEETKQSFKSKKIKEVRENLQRAVSSSILKDSDIHKFKRGACESAHGWKAEAQQATVVI